MLNGIEPLCIISFTIPGQPKAWARARRQGKKYFKSADQKAWAERIRNYFAVARRNIHHGSRVITWPHDGPVAVYVVGYYPVPENPKPTRDWPAWKRIAALAKSIPFLGVPDADNVVKGVMDALNNLAYTDDRRVFHESGTKYYVAPEDARLEVEIHFYPEITESNYGI